MREEELVQARQHAPRLVLASQVATAHSAATRRLSSSRRSSSRACSDALADERLPALVQRSEVVAGMALAGRRERVGRFGCELLGRVLAQQLVQLVAAEVRAADERLRHEIGEQAQIGARDRGGRLTSVVAAEHREPREDILLLAGEQPPRLVERGAEAAMPLRDVAHRRGEEIDVLLDLVRDLRAREHRHPRGGELDAQGQALDQPADAARLGALVVVEREARLDLRRALDEEAQRAGAPVPVLREAEAVHVEHPFALHVETLTRRRQQLDLRCALDDLPEQVGAVDEVLEVVEHEQRRPLAQVVEELLLRREAAVGAVHRELDRLGNRRRQELRRGHRDERDEVHAVRVAFDPARGGLERESRLARPARADEREQAAVGILEQPVDLVELRRAADERRAWGRQVLHARLDRLQQREVARSPSISSW